MITLVTETSFRDKGGIYRRFNIQVLHSTDRGYDMIVVNLDGYDVITVGLDDSSFKDNKELFYKHIETMFGLKDFDNYKFILIENNVAYVRESHKGNPYYGEFVYTEDGESIEKEYKKFLET